MKVEKVRQLVAVMFTDIVGYTALMQGDEEVAAKVRAKHRRIFEEQHALHQGKIIQYYGDGTLSVFDSAVEAAKCSIAIQRLLQEGDKVPLRIGLHLGDIVFNHTEVYGDGVNFASRIESLSSAGAILLSDKLNDELKNQPSISTVSLGRFDLKNISRPVEVFAISNEGINVPVASDLKGKLAASNITIAVLPFVNLSTNQDNEYFCDGISEEIINALAKIKSLKVTSRTSSFLLKDKNIPIKQIGKELGVSTIIEGSVRLSGDIIRITAQLIQAEEDFHFWSETWDRKLENIFEIQDEISLIIADRIREQFGHFELQEHLVEKQTDNIDAYEYSLKAHFLRNKWNPEDVKRAISFYEKALELDLKHTESHLGLAECYSFLGTTGFMPFEEAWRKSAKYTNNALELNSHSSGVHFQLANQAFFIDCDYSKSLKEMQKAIEINPNNADAQQFISFLYIIAGDKERSSNHLDIAISINPLSEETHFFRAYYHYMIEDYPQALEMLDRCLSVNDKNIPAHSIKSLCLLKLGKYDEVIGYFDTIPPDVIIQGEKTGSIALAYAFRDDAVNTAIYLDQLKERAKDPNGFTEDSYLFLMHVAMGEYDQAFAWVSQAIKNKSSLLLVRYSDPIANSLRTDPRYNQFHKLIFEIDGASMHQKKKKALLDNKKIRTYTARLINHIAENKPYLEPNLSLRTLAAQIDIHPNQLSWLINESLGKNFNQFINHYRIEFFKALTRDPKNANITIIGLAYDSGFNSKTVFNTYFKKETGLSPRQFLNQ